MENILSPMIEVIIKDPAPFFILLFGAMSYWVASGAANSNYKTLHATLGITIFSVVGFLIYYLISMYWGASKFIGACSGIAVAGLFAYFWRIWLAEKVFVWLRGFGITAISFGPSRVWDAIMSTPRLNFQRYHVKLKGEEEIWLISSMDALDEINGIACPSEALMADAEGNVALLVTEICKGGERTECKLIEEKTGYTEYTYIPASNIDTIKIFIEKKKTTNLC